MTIADTETELIEYITEQWSWYLEDPHYIRFEMAVLAVLEYALDVMEAEAKTWAEGTQ